MTVAARVQTIVLPFCLGASTLVYQGYGQRWWRAHAGDALVVAFLVGLLGLVPAWSLRRRLGIVAVVSAGLELGQLGADASGRSAGAALLLGSHFDPLDFAYYAVGLGLAVVLEESSSVWRRRG